MINLFTILIYLVKVLGGILFVHLLWNVREPRYVVLKVFLGAGIGMGISSLLYFLWYWFGLPAVFYFYFELGLIFLLMVVFFVQEKSHVTRIVFHWPALSKQSVVWLLFAFFAVGSCLLQLVLNISQSPHGISDSWTIWNAAARFIYRSGDNSWFLLLSQGAWLHPDYPLFVGLNIVEEWATLGSEPVLAQMVLPLILTMGVIGLIFSSLTIIDDIQQGSLGAIVIASISWLPYYAALEYADVPLSYFFLGTGVLLYLYTVLEDDKLLILAGLFAGISAWTKNEGILFAIISVAVCILIGFRTKKSLIRHFALGLALPFVVIVLFKTLTTGSDLFGNLSQSMLQFLDPSRYQLIASSMLSFIFAFGGWPVSFVLVFLLYAAIVRKKSRILGMPWVLLFLLVLQLLGYFMIYVMTPHGLEGHIHTSLDRLILQILPLGILLTFIGLSSPQEIFASSDNVIAPDHDMDV